MRIALAQVNVTVGDLASNVDVCLDAVAQAAAAGADLVVLPELALTGYPPEDLLLRGDFIDATRAALERFASSCRIPSLVGFVERDAAGLRNAAAFCRDGRVDAVYFKHRLPNYGVFDEQRYFEPGDRVSIVDVGGVAVGVTICEDIWIASVAARVAEAGAHVIVNLSASPFHAGKALERERMLSDRARECGVPIAYCNLVGGQDELVFDGRSMVLDSSGSVVSRAHAFEPCIVLADVDPPELGAPSRATAVESPAASVSGEAEVYQALVTGVRDYVRKNGFTDVVLGLSGGIDSALVAVLAADALGPDRVHVVLMPGRYSSEGSVEDSLELVRRTGIEARTLSIEPAYQALLNTLESSFAGSEPGVAEENLQARVRGTLVMALSNRFGWLALATGNKSELSVGYGTLYGDMAGGFAPIKDVLKTRVWDLARWRNTQDDVAPIPVEIIEKEPSAELRHDQRDEDSLPPYAVLDAVLERYVEGDLDRGAIIATGIAPEVVDRVIALTDAAEHKRRQGAPGVKITPKAFGKDRRMPITNRYRG